VTNGGVTLAFIGTLSIEHEALRFRPCPGALDLPGLVKCGLGLKRSCGLCLLSLGCSLAHLFTRWVLRLRWKGAVLKVGIRRGLAGRNLDRRRLGGQRSGGVGVCRTFATASKDATDFCSNGGVLGPAVGGAHSSGGGKGRCRVENMGGYLRRTVCLHDVACRSARHNKSH